ncbi:MAG: peptidylprolyl isomerase [Porticoccaceae bacterium]|nr:peptidylprolyl isomerase [Porticoccaceae bacterium]
MNELSTSTTNGKITRNSQVTLHFSVALEDGSIIDSNFDGTPARFTMGDGSLLSGFEDVLIDMSVGQENSFLITPEHSFGQHNPSNLQTIKRKQFAPDMALSVGLVVSFADAAKGELPGVISSLNDDEVIVDFNHPLAGKAILFKVQIIKVQGIEVQPSASDGQELEA